MAIKNGEVADADEVMATYGKMFKNQSQLIFNADLIGWDSDLDEEFEDVTYDTLKDNSKIDSTNSEIKDIPVFGALVMDDFEDDSIDTNIWSTSATAGGTVTEAGGVLYVRAAGSGGSGSVTKATADQVNAEDFNDDCTIFFGYDVGHVSGTVTIKLIDESANEVTLLTLNTNATNQQFRANVIPGSNNVDVYSNFEGSGSPTAVDVSSLQDGDEWNLQFRGDCGVSPDDGWIKAYFVRFLRNSTETVDFISDAVTSSSTITDAILVANTTIGSGASAVYYLSADNGANYEAVTLNEVHRFTNTGTQLKVKVEMDNSATDDIFQLNHYAVWYNTGAS